MNTQSGIENPDLRICVFGAGAIGSHLAVRLASVGARVCIVARGEKLKAIKENGLTLKSADFDPINVRLQASDDPAALGEQDIVLVAVKLPALPEVLRSAAPLIGRNTRVIFVMNGLPWWFPNGIPQLQSAGLGDLLDPTRELSALLPERQWVACAITSGNRVVEPGVVLNTSRRGNMLSFGFSDGRHDEDLAALEAMLVRSGMKAALVPDIRHAIWRKLLINAALSAIATICERDTRQICQDPETRRIVVAAMCEILAIGRSIGIDIDADPVALTEPDRQPAHITSFLQDLRAGRKLEISNGILAVRAIGWATRTPIPHLDTVAALLHARSPRA